MRLITLGGLRLEGTPLVGSKSLLLLAYLILEGPRRRSTLAELFFLDSQDRNDALSTTLRRLRPLGVLEEAGGRVGVRLACDASAFLEGDWNAYAGPFVDGLSVPLPPDLESWVLETRETVARRRRDGHLHEAEAARRSGDWARLEREGAAVLEVRGAPPLEPHDLMRLSALLPAGSLLRPRLEREAHSLGLRWPSLAQALRPQAGQADRVALPGSDESPHTLPHPLTSFVGRGLERSQLAAWLHERRVRLVTLSGPGGIGKTRLALRVAHELRETPALEGDVCFVALDTLGTAEALWPHLLSVLHLSPARDEAPLEALVRHLAQERRLLVLDNFENLLDARAGLNTLLERCAALTVLVTSRVRLNLRAEWALTLEGLSGPPTPDRSRVPDAGGEGSRDALERLSGSEAVQLFLERAVQARPGFTLTAGNAALVERLCAWCGGFPLALELAAAGLRSHSLDSLIERFERGGLTLESPYADVQARHRSMAGVLESSWAMLDPLEASGLARLARFAGGFTPEAASRVAGVDAATLERLTLHSLLRVSLEGRFDFHPLILEFARLKLLEPPQDAAAVRAAHAGYFLAVLHRLNLEASGGVSPDLFAFLKAEEGNVLATLEHLRLERRFADLAQLFEPLLWHFPVQGRFAEGLRLCAELVAGWPDEDPDTFEALAAVLCSAAWLNFYAGSLETGYALAQRALEVARQAGSALQTLRALGHLGEICSFRGLHAEALEAFTGGVQAAERSGDPVRRLRILSALGLAHAVGHTPEHAPVTLEHAHTLLSSGQVPMSMDAATHLTVRAAVHLTRGEWSAGLEAARDGLGLASQIGSSGHEAGFHGLIAALLSGRGTPQDLERAEGLVSRVMPLVRHTREPFAHTLLSLAAARLALRRGQARAALEGALESLELTLNCGALGLFTWVLPPLAQASLELDESARAAEVLHYLLTSPTAGRWVRDQALELRAACSFEALGDESRSEHTAATLLTSLRDTVWALER